LATFQDGAGGLLNKVTAVYSFSCKGLWLNASFAISCSFSHVTQRSFSSQTRNVLTYSFLSGMVEKDLFNHFDKFTNGLLHAKAKEARLREAVNQTDDPDSSTCTNDTISDKTKGLSIPQSTPEEFLRKHVQSLKVL
jgi:hypothetical protein